MFYLENLRRLDGLAQKDRGIIAIRMGIACYSAIDPPDLVRVSSPSASWLLFYMCSR